MNNLVHDVKTNDQLQLKNFQDAVIKIKELSEYTQHDIFVGQ